MQLGVVGLGRMGGNIVRRLLRAGHDCVVHDRDPAPGRALAGEGATAAGGLAGLVAALDAPRAVWVMLPSGEATEGAVEALSRLLSPGDTVIDGGNSFWKDDVRRGRGARRTRPRLPRRRHERRGVGARARLLPDDRRRGGGGAAARPDLQGARARPRRHPVDRRARRPRRPRRGGLPPCRAERRRPFRQDDPQRHRVRHDAGDGRGLRHLEERRRAEARRRPPLRLRPRRRRRGLAARQRRHLLAPRPDGAGARPRRRALGLLRPCRGFGRGPLDRDGGGRGGGAGRGAHRRALRPLPLAPGAHLRREGALGDAPGLRRPCRAEDLRAEAAAAPEKGGA